MATTSEVKAGLDAIATSIAGSSQAFERAKANILAARNQLAALPTVHSDAISAVNGYTPTGAFETLSKDELAKLTTEFQALKATLETALTDLGVSFT